MEDYAVEDIRVDPADMNSAFKRGLRSSGINYLEELQKMATNDYELEGEGETIANAFEMLKRYVLSGRKGITSFDLKDLLEFNLTADIVSRIGYLAFQHDSISPLSSLVKKKSRAFDSKTSVDEYDDDFEVEDEEEEQGNLGSSDELFIEKSTSKSPSKSPSKAPIRTGGDRYGAKRVGDGSDDYSDVEDLEEATYDRGKNTRQTRPDANVPVTPQQVTRMHPRISPEVNYSSQRADPRDHATASSVVMSPPKPAVAASAAFLPVRKAGLSHTTATTSPSASTDASNAAATAASNAASRASTAGNAAAKRATRVSRSSHNGRIKTANWIETRAWRLGEKIGAGAFGEVFQGLNDKGTLFAVKRMNMSNQPSEVDNLLAEIQLMRGLSHPHIVEYLGAWVDTVEGNLYIFQEWVPGGSVAHLLKQFGAFSLGVVREYTRQILLGLQYLHENGIIHRDIKGGNILVDANRTVKLADFGASTQLTQFNQTQVTTTVKGTPYFMAPEVLASSRYGRKGDIWAVGCTMIQMLTGEPPWKDRNLKGLVQLHLLLTSWDQGPPPYSCAVTPEARECLELCFQKVDTNRPTATELLDCKFLEEDDLDDSFNSNMNGVHDPLEDSGVLRGLKQEMSKVVSRSVVGVHALQNQDTDDTIANIDKQLADRAQRKSAANAPAPLPGQSKPPASNPYGYQNLRPQGKVNFPGEPPVINTSAVAPGSPEKGRWESELPPGQFSDSPARYSQQVSAGSQSTATTPYSASSGRPAVPSLIGASPSTNNPFARGATGVKKSVAMSPASRVDGDGNRVSPAEIITPRLASDNVITPRGASENNPYKSGGPAPRASGLSGQGAGAVTSPTALEVDNAAVVRDSLQVLKKRIPSSGGQRRPGAPSTGSRYAQGGNISSNRDTEELTPYPQDASDSEDYSSRHRDRDRDRDRDGDRHRDRDRDHSAARGGAAHAGGAHGGVGQAGAGRYTQDPRSYESYDSNEINDEDPDLYSPPPLQQQDSLASIEEEALAVSGAHEREEYYNYNNSRNSSGDSRDPHRVHPAGSYGAGRGGSMKETGGAYTRPKTQSRETGASQSSRVAPAVMKKSSSDFSRADVATASGVSSHHNRVVVRREVSTSHSGVGTSQQGLSAVERRVKPYPTEKKSVSASVRRTAPLPVVEAQHRPYTSKASFGGGAGAAPASHAAPSSNGSRNSSANSHHSHSQSHGGGDGSDTDGDDDAWLCLKCGCENSNSGHCEHCATVRGSDGKTLHKH